MASDDKRDDDIENDASTTDKKPDDIENDPHLPELLDMFDKDIAEGKCVPLTQEFFDRIAELVEGVEVDLDAPIEGDVAIGMDPLAAMIESEDSTKH